VAISNHIFKPHPSAYTNRNKILDTILNHPGQNAEEIAAAVGVTYGTVHKQTLILISLGLVHSEPDPSNSKMKRYFAGPPTPKTFNAKKERSRRKRFP
jgi:predicted transcriptional regulator